MSKIWKKLPWWLKLSLIGPVILIIYTNLRLPNELAEGEKYSFFTVQPLNLNEIIPAIKGFYADFNLLYGLIALVAGILLLMLLGRANIFASLKKEVKQIPDFESEE